MKEMFIYNKGTDTTEDTECCLKCKLLEFYVLFRFIKRTSGGNSTKFIRNLGTGIQ